MAKIYKVKDRLAIYIPYEVIEALGVKEGDDIDFFKYDKYFVVAKKDDILKMMLQQNTPQSQAQQKPASGPSISISNDELMVLKRLDSIKYNERTKERLKQALNQNEKKILVGLIKRKLVSSFKKAGEQTPKYGIAKSVYNQYLFGKRVPASQQQQKPVTIQIPQVQIQRIDAPAPKRWEQALGGGNVYLTALEQNGFLVVANQSEATSVSQELEQSIRTGQVIGTRAFNKKYYITLKAFVSRNAQRVVKAIGTKTVSIADIAKATGIEEEGVRAILYIMAENGEVTESKKDTFRVV